MEETPRAKYTEKEKVSVFNNEFLPHINSMYNFGYRLTLDEDDAKDMLQESFIRVYNYRKQFDPSQSLGGWIRKIVINTSLNFIKSLYRISPAAFI